ncbi:dienelactone hydrolase family protein [Amycolatopsis pithecellobii]|uniref:Alpha/beta hydrolase n=1 Tax=Amycolatopsis pithecellobii TaxID=664692 RepID=A0A6N7Z616_9PSEU|nr:dienelactone hydrolase family protein [Amycolatopsis pithecellobii]MTD56261.1 alpha/beta hydrolase [Amycolatopsis pithecellobii]
MAKPKELLEELAHPGPHEVVRGNLALAGLPGVVFTPRSGLGLPGVAFGHGWLQPPGRYRALLSHLASWGIVAAAPSTQRGPLPSHRIFAADLRATLDLITGVRLGPGGLSVDPAKLGLAGHSVGGGSAVLAAADDSRVRAVATFAAAQTLPPATDAARKITVPGLHLAAEGDLVTPAAGNAEAIAKAWGGPVQLRLLGKSSHLAVTEGTHWSQRLLHGKPQRRTQRVVRALFTAFFLTELGGSDKFRALLEADVKRAAIEYDPGLERAA